MSALIALLASGWLASAGAALAGGVVTLAFGGDWSLALIAAATLAGAVVAWRCFGLQGALAVLAAGAIVFAGRRGERRGAAAQAAKEKEDADRRAVARERIVEDVRQADADDLRRRARRWLRDGG